MIQIANRYIEFLKSHKAILLVIFLYCLPGSFTMLAQNGDIYGVITEDGSGEPLPGASIYIEGIGMGTVSNKEGEYRLSNIPEGTHAVVFSYISFLDEEKEVLIKSGESIKIDIRMAYDAVSLGEVIVTSQLLGQARALNQQLTSDAIVNVVSSDKIKELPDANAAEAIGRLPGISVNRIGGEANTVVVRGLSPKLTSVTINGVRVSSTSGTDRSVSLNMVSPELLSSIEVFKSPTADMDGDAIGGIVNLGVMKAPNKPEATLRLNGGYNGLDNKFGNYKGAVDLSKRFFDNKLGVYLKANYEVMNRSSESINNKYYNDAGDSVGVEGWPIKSTRLQDNNRTITRIGSSAGFDYQYNSGEVTGLVFYSHRNTDIQKNENDIGESTTITHSPRHHKYNNSVMQGMLSGKQQLNFIEMNWTLSSNKIINDNYHDLSVEIEEHNAQEESYAYTPKEKTNLRLFNYDQAWLFNTNFEPEKTEHQNYTAALDFKIDFNLPGKLSGFMKFGGKYRFDDRVHNIDYYSVYEYYWNDDLNDIAAENMLPHTTDRGGPNDRKIMMSNFASDNDQLGIWNNEYFIAPLMDMDYLNLWYDRQKADMQEWPDESQDYRNYEVRETVAAGYFMVKLKYGNWLSLIPGVRYEHSDNEYLGYMSTKDTYGTGITRDTTIYKQYGELLPSLHAKIKPISWFDVRLSAVKTLARPDYNMITPRVRINVTDASLYQANPDLKHTEAWNYDAVFSFFSNKLGLFSIGGFYKQFDNYFSRTSGVMSAEEALEKGYPAQAYEVPEDYLNFDDSEVYGFELDIQTNLDYLPSPFNGVVLSMNVTRLWSKTYLPRFFKIEYYDPDLRRTVIDYENSYTELSEIKLPDQKEWMGNFVIGYDYKGFSGRISTNYQAASLKTFNSSSEKEGAKYNENYIDAFLRIDASLAQKIGENLKVMVNFANITGEGEREYQYKKRYWKKDNRYGMTVDLGIQYSFF